MFAAESSVFTNANDQHLCLHQRSINFELHRIMSASWTFIQADSNSRIIVRSLEIRTHRRFFSKSSKLLNVPANIWSAVYLYAQKSHSFTRRHAHIRMETHTSTQIYGLTNKWLTSSDIILSVVLYTYVRMFAFRMGKQVKALASKMYVYAR